MEDPVEDVTVLFQTSGIDSIKDVERQIRSDIEKKKEELRVMVGERYRDLINAADTIKDMTAATCEVFQGVGSISHLCNTFNEVNERSVKRTGSLEGKIVNPKQEAFYSLATQMDLLVDTPEKIWSALDMCQYLLSAKLYLIAQHIVNNSLHINKGAQQINKKSQRDVFASFPILHHQWAAISHFKSSILKGARASMKDPTLPDKALSESLCCITLLDNLSPKQIFMEFLSARKAAIMDTFHPSLQTHSVKKQICDVTYLVQFTIQQIVVTFYTPDQDTDSPRTGKPLFYNLLEEVTKYSRTEKSEQETLPTNDALQFLYGEEVDVPTVSRHLPADVLGFVPVLRSPAVIINQAYLRKHVSEWLIESIEQIQSGVRDLLQYVTNIKGLAIIRDAVYELLKERHTVGQTEQGDFGNENSAVLSWKDYCHICLDKELSIWSQFFQPLFLERAKAILDKQLTSCFTSLKDALDVTLTNIADPLNTIDDSCWDHDITGFLWHEFPQEVSTMMEPKDQNTEESMLSLKVKACTPSIKRLCSLLNNALNGLLSDVKHFLSAEEEKDNTEESRLQAIRKDVQKLLFDVDSQDTEIEPFDRFADAAVIRQYMIDSFCQNLKGLCVHLSATLDKQQHALSQKETDEFGTESDTTALLDTITFIARLCLSLPELCHSIEKLLFSEQDVKRPKRQLSRHHSRRKLTGKDGSKLDMIEESLREETQKAYKIWSRWVVESCKKSMHDISSNADDLFLFSTTNWEEVAIEEEGEEGKRIKSRIKVPCQPSFYLSSLLFRLSEEIHRIGSHVLERAIVNNLLAEVGNAIFTTHEKMTSSSRDNQLYQNRVLQMMFDVKFVTSLFAGDTDVKVESLIAMRKRGDLLVRTLEKFVDPFDLDVFIPHMNNFVNRHLQRSWLILGTISNLDKHVVHAHRPSSSSSEVHSVVPMTASPARFMLLPIANHGKEPAEGIPAQYELDPGFDHRISPLFLHQRQNTIQGIV